MTDNYDLTNKNFFQYAIRCYDNPGCLDVDEFKEDLNTFKYIKRLLRKYQQSGELNEKLILNHLITLYNIFGNHATKMLFLKIDENLYPFLKPFLVFLSKLPDEINMVKGIIIYTTEIQMDDKIIAALRMINRNASMD